MLNSGSCDMAGSAFDGFVGGRIQRLSQRLPYSGPHSPDLEPLQQVARDFASVFYTILVQQMQKGTQVGAEEGGALADGVGDFVAMLLPRQIAGSRRDALTEYIYEHLSTQDGGLVDETA